MASKYSAEAIDRYRCQIAGSNIYNIITKALILRTADVVFG